jgi:hypothetical protein
MSPCGERRRRRKTIGESRFIDDFRGTCSAVGRDAAGGTSRPGTRLPASTKGVRMYRHVRELQFTSKPEKPDALFAM